LQPPHMTSITGPIFPASVGNTEILFFSLILKS
jgi:hypothetical protein